MDQCLRSTTLLQPDQFGSTMIKEEPPSPGSDGTFLHSPCSEAPSVLSDADTSHLTEKDKAALEILMEDVPVSTDEYFDSGGYSTQSFQTNPSLEALNLAGEGIQIEEISHDECASISNVLNKVNEMNSYFTPPPPYPEAVPSRVPPYHTPYQCYPSYQEEYVNYDQIQDTTLRAMLQRRPNNAGYPPHVAISPPPAYGTGSPPLNCGNARKPTTEGAGSRRVSSDKENTTEDGRVRRRCSLKSMPLEQRKARRREQNRLAAQRCRQRKKVVNVDIEEQYRAEFNKYTQLKDEVDFIREERDRLQKILDDHMLTGCPSMAQAQQQCKSTSMLPYEVPKTG